MTKLLRITILFLFTLCTISCVHEAFSPLTNDGGSFQTIKFSSCDFEKVQITTRSTLGEIAERRMINLYALIFDNTGKLVYSHYFDNSERKASLAALEPDQYGWAVEDNGSTTSGTLRMKAPNLSNCKFYLIGNTEGVLNNLSPASLSMIKTEQDLLNFVLSYHIGTNVRTGRFIMVGKANLLSVVDNVATFGDGDIPIELERIDSKIEFRVAIVPGAVTVHNQGTPEESTQTIESFEPTNWQVINMPKSCYLYEQEADAYPTDESNFFSDEPFGFETSFTQDYGGDERIVHGFSFYMLENRQSGQKHGVVPTGSELPTGFSSYHYRDKRNKTASGTYTTTGPMWQYAPENSTYVKIEGVVKMQYEGAIVTSQTLHSLATYYIHLGDFATDINNYDVLRNTHYIYTVNIYGADNIQVEVEKDNAIGWTPTNEKESGATGEVFVSQEEVYVFDAHYGQRVFRFHAPSMIGQSGGDINKLTWFVSTPFGHRGMPQKVGTEQTDVSTGLDYKWVHFYINSKDATYIDPHGNSDGSPLTITNTSYPNYCHVNRAWPGSGSPDLMDVVSFCDLLRKELKKYNDDPTNSNPDPAKHHIFDSNGDMYVTVFVDEFYYKLDPTSDESRASLWHEFTNKPMRTMHIMCNSSVSTDEESSLILSAVSLRQLSIQTIYNFETAAEGWGSETNDEFAIRHAARFFNYNTESRAANMNSTQNHHLGPNARNTSKMNGLYNSGHLWGLLDESDSYVANKYWSEYIDYNQSNEVGSLNNFLRKTPTTETLRYACLSRNRDENGNGIIDKDEVKWYTASLGQLQELYLGQFGVTGDARLYNVKAPSNTLLTDNNGDGYYHWRNHVVSSTATPSLPTENGPKDNNYRPLFLWTEEGVSVSQYGMDSNWGKSAIYSIRCVRNLDNGLLTHNMEDEQDVPTSIVDVTLNSDGTYTFDFTRLNDLSKRPAINSQMLALDENSSMSLVSDSFKTGDVARNADNSVLRQDYNYYYTIKDNLDKGIGLCAEGYHVPNIREMTSIYIYANNLIGGGNKFFVCNYFSFGHTDIGGNGFDAVANNDESQKQITWTFTNNNITLDPGVTNVQIRCVKDL